MIVEMRTYTLKPGTVATVEERFGQALPARLNFSKLAALWHTEVGQLNQIIHVWPYDSLAHREQARAAAAKAVGWPPNIAEFIIEAKAEIFIPAPFSPPLAETRSGQPLRDSHLHLRAGRHTHSYRALERENRSADEAVAARRMLVFGPGRAEQMGPYLGLPRLCRTRAHPP